MPRNYVRSVGSRTYKEYTPERVQDAVASVRSSRYSIREAARFYGVSYGTIFNKIHDLHSGKNGGQTVLTGEEESDLCSVIQIAGDWGFPLTTANVKELVKGFLDENSMTSRFVNNIPGNDWMYGFMKRNRHNLASRSSQNIKRSRAKVDPDTINSYFDHLSVTLKDIPPGNIINYDETNFSDDPESKRVVVRRGLKHVDNVLDHSKSSYSVMFAGAANGEVLPPYIVYAALHLYPTWTEGGPKGTRYNRTKSGWFDTLIFEDWFMKVALVYCQGLENIKPRVVIGDNVASHLSYKVIKTCLENNIRFVFLPPNATHLCQPLDVAYFRPLKIAWKKNLEEWKKRRKGTVPKHLFPGLLKKTLESIKNTSKKNMQAGFRASGVFPLSRYAVLKRIPGGSSTPEGGPKQGFPDEKDSSFSRQLISILKEERYGSKQDRAIPRKRRLIDIKPGESLTEEQAAEILVKKEKPDKENKQPKGTRKKHQNKLPEKATELFVKKEKPDNENKENTDPVKKPKQSKGTRNIRKKKICKNSPAKD